MSFYSQFSQDVRAAARVGRARRARREYLNGAPSGRALPAENSL